MGIRDFIADVARVKERRAEWRVYERAALDAGHRPPGVGESPNGAVLPPTPVPPPVASQNGLGPGASWIAIASFVALGATICALIFFDNWVDSSSLFITLPVQIVLGSIAFLTGVTFIVVVFARLNLHNREHALGLPDGSIRALIALILIVIFFIFANSVFGTLQNDKVVVYTGLTLEQVAELPSVISRVQDETSTPDSPTFSGKYLQSVNDDAVALGQQLITALITLVAAISAFYFGSSAVRTATDSAIRVAASAGSLGTAIVPSVTDRSLPAARDLLNRQGFTADVTRETSPKPVDEVTGQQPQGGSEAPLGVPIQLTVSSGPDVPPVEVPPADVPPGEGPPR